MRPAEITARVRGAKAIEHLTLEKKNTAAKNKKNMSETIKVFRSIAQDLVDPVLQNTGVFLIDSISTNYPNLIRRNIIKATINYLEYLFEEGVIIPVDIGEYRVRTVEEIADETQTLLDY